MKSAHTVSIVLFSLLIIPLIVILPQTGASDTSLFFFDHFDGEVVDSSKWAVEENTHNSGYPAYGGSVSVSGSDLMLSSDGSSFPFVQTIVNPFPTIGDFTVQFNVTYTCIADLGCGIMFGQGVPYIERSSGLCSGGEKWKNRVFTLWAADQGPTEGIIYIEMFNTLVWNITVQGFKPSSVQHLYKLVYLQGVYTVYVDGEQVALVASKIRPDTIILGSPPLYYIPFSSESMAKSEYGWTFWGWSSFNIDYISVAQLKPSQISVSAYAETLQTGYRVNISGNLSSSEGKPLTKENIVISYSIPGTLNWNPISAATTDSNGLFAVVWISPALGKFTIKAEWIGNEAYSSASDMMNISILQDADQNLFTAESNSNLSSLSFNATSKEISFSVSGPSGSTGYVRFMISKALLNNQSDFKVYLDSQQISFTLSSIGNMFMIYFEYHHSSHEIDINLSENASAAPMTSLTLASTQTPTLTPSSSIPEFPAWTILSIVVLMTLLTAVIIRMKK